MPEEEYTAEDDEETEDDAGELEIEDADEESDEGAGEEKEKSSHIPIALKVLLLVAAGALDVLQVIEVTGIGIIIMYVVRFLFASFIVVSLWLFAPGLRRRPGRFMKKVIPKSVGGLLLGGAVPLTQTAFMLWTFAEERSGVRSR